MRPRIYVRYHRPGIHFFYGYYPHRPRHRHYHYYYQAPQQQVIIVEREEEFLPPLECPSQSSAHQSGFEQWCATPRGTLHGLFLRWHENGHIALEGNYESGERHGVWTEWFETGQVRLEGEYDDGARTGTWVQWNEEGQQISITNYE